MCPVSIGVPLVLLDPLKTDTEMYKSPTRAPVKGPKSGQSIPALDAPLKGQPCPKVKGMDCGP